MADPGVPAGVPADGEIRAAVAGLLSQRAAGQTICPSEAARSLAADAGPGAWRALMDDVRRVAFAMADAGLLEVTQRGEVVDGRTARGPIRLRAGVPASP